MASEEELTISHSANPVARSQTFAISENALPAQQRADTPEYASFSREISLEYKSRTGTWVLPRGQKCQGMWMSSMVPFFGYPRRQQATRAPLFQSRYKYVYGVAKGSCLSNSFASGNLVHILNSGPHPNFLATFHSRIAMLWIYCGVGVALLRMASAVNTTFGVTDQRLVYSYTPDGKPPSDRPCVEPGV